MDYKSKIRDGLEEALKSDPEILGKKQLVFFEDKEVDWSQKERRDVEVYLEDGYCSGSYHVHICGTRFVAMVSYAVDKYLRTKLKGALISCSGTVEEDVILITITE